MAGLHTERTDGDGDDVVTSLLHTPAQQSPYAVRSMN